MSCERWRLQREQDPKSPFVFTSERAAPFSSAGFARMIERAGIEAKFGFKPHPHMLRHACGYALAKRSQEYPAHGAIYGTITGSVQKLLARMSKAMRQEPTESEPWRHLN
jgi:integrase